MSSTDRPPTVSTVVPAIEQTKGHKTHFAVPLKPPARGTGVKTGGVDETEALVLTSNIEVAYIFGRVILVLRVGVG